MHHLKSPDVVCLSLSAEELPHQPLLPGLKAPGVELSIEDGGEEHGGLVVVVVVVLQPDLHRHAAGGGQLGHWQADLGQGVGLHELDQLLPGLQPHHQEEEDMRYEGGHAGVSVRRVL